MTKRSKILIVDDDPELRDALTEQLSLHEEFEAVAVENGSKSVQAAKGWRASIFSPGSTSPWPNSPVNLEKSSAEEIVAEAKRIIEVRPGPRLL
jgi:CheY-like chemotaxis protein